MLGHTFKFLKDEKTFTKFVAKTKDVITDLNTSTANARKYLNHPVWEILAIKRLKEGLIDLEELIKELPDIRDNLIVKDRKTQVQEAPKYIYHPVFGDLARKILRDKKIGEERCSE